MAREHLLSLSHVKERKQSQVLSPKGSDVHLILKSEQAQNSRIEDGKKNFLNIQCSHGPICMTPFFLRNCKSYEIFSDCCSVSSHVPCVLAKN